jgi:hypothetical protein
VLPFTNRDVIRDSAVQLGLTHHVVQMVLTHRVNSTVGKASLGCGQLSVGGEVTNRVTIHES